MTSNMVGATGSPKLTPRQVREIRYARLYQNARQASLARRYGVSEATISRLMRGLTLAYGPAEAR